MLLLKGPTKQALLHVYTHKKLNQKVNKSCEEDYNLP